MLTRREFARSTELLDRPLYEPIRLPRFPPNCGYQLYDLELRPQKGMNTGTVETEGDHDARGTSQILATCKQLLSAAIRFQQTRVGIWVALGAMESLRRCIYVPQPVSLVPQQRLQRGISMSTL